MSVCKCVIWSVNLLQKPGDITWANFCASATTISWRKGTFFNHWHGSTWSPWYGCLFGMFPYKKGLFSDRPKPRIFRIFLRLCIKKFRAARALLFHQTTGPKVLALCALFAFLSIFKSHYSIYCDRAELVKLDPVYKILQNDYYKNLRSNQRATRYQI